MMMKRRSSLQRKAERSTLDDDDDDDEPISLFVAVSHLALAEHAFSILQLEPPHVIVNNHDSSKARMIPTEFSVNFSMVNFSKPWSKQTVLWDSSPLVTCTKSHLYIVPDWYSSSFKRDRTPLACGIFDLRSKTWTPIKAPHSPKYSATVLTLGNHIYFMADPEQGVNPSLHLCERYNTLQGSWEVLEPYPDYDVDHVVGHPGNIVATLVLDDTILLCIDGHQIWAYYAPKGHWYLVNVKNQLCYRMIGQTVALKNTIYAIPTGKDDKVMELSLERRKINGGLVFTLDLRSEISVPGLKSTKLGVKLKHTFAWTSHFVHLGKDNFCLVLGCNFNTSIEYQSIQVTYIKLNGKYSTVTNRCVHKFKTPGFRQFHVSCCFSLPKSKTTMLEQGQRLFTVNLNPGAGIETPKVGRPTPVDCSSVRTKLYFGPKASTGDGDGAERNDTDEEGHSMCEKSFPPDITLRRFVEELNNYGPKGFRIMTDTVGNLSAYVKFESEKRLSFFTPDITLGRFVKDLKNYGPDEYRLMIDNTGNFCAFESPSYKKEALRKTNTVSEDVDSDDSMFDLDTDESSSESDSDELSEEETPAKVGKKRSRDSEPKTTAANKKMRDDKNASKYFSCCNSPFASD